jgi:biotin operon repressor
MADLKRLAAIRERLEAKREAIQEAMEGLPRSGGVQLRKVGGHGKALNGHHM